MVENFKVKCKLNFLTLVEFKDFFKWIEIN